ncbi:MAG: Planctomycete cytochrome [Verrucomicrobiaceae bacterium]|nr:Planctomycete cytochrome [Verrucomicrobiaceae bacterium]
MVTPFISFGPLGVSVLLLAVASNAFGGKIDFQQDVRPILSDRCFKCHGPDVDKRKAGLRLDVREDSLKPAKSGEHAVVPGKPDASELIARIFSADEKEIMPPPEMKKPLSEEQKVILKRWIAEGAEYQPHWAYVKPVTPYSPPVKQTAWVRNPIDAFVLAKLEASGMRPAAPATLQALARRAALDLTGLPPPPKPSLPSSETPLTTATRLLLTLCSPHLITVNAGRGVGWILPVTLIPMAMRRTVNGVSGPIATGW